MNTTFSKFDDSYWTNRYKGNKTGWDIGYPSTPLKEYIDQLTDKSIRILIPGCGNSYEADYLLQKGFTNITLIDISEILVNCLRNKFSENTVRILHEDFFLHKDKYDLILEQTFFCALHPSQRIDYARKMKEILTEDGKLAGVLFNREFDEGPPFGGNEIEYRKLFASYFSKIKIESCYNSIESRKGTEVFIMLGK
jgi:SAM-dependent methyltransferase